MKSSLLLLLMLACAFSTFAQETDPPAPEKGSYEYYMQKKRNNVTTGAILLGGGVLLGVIGFSMELGSMYNDNASHGSLGSVFFFTGVAAVAGSVPFFIVRDQTNERHYR